MENSKKYTVITVGRQFGSGGRELGRRLAEALGFEFYDKKLLPEAAKAAGMDVSFFEQADEKFPSFASGSMPVNIGYNPMPLYTASSISDEALNRQMADLITALASRGNCVIVGRTADYVLRNHPDAEVISIFVHAPMADLSSTFIRNAIAKGRDMNFFLPAGVYKYIVENKLYTGTAGVNKK